MISFYTFNFFSSSASKPQASGSAASYGSVDTRDELIASKKQGFAGRVENLISKITDTISKLAPEESPLRNLRFLIIFEKPIFDNLITVHENQNCSFNNWPFRLNEEDLKNFLLCVNLDIRIYRDQPNKRAKLLRDLMVLCNSLSQIYCFTQEECQLIKSFQSEASYKQLYFDLMSYIENLESNSYDKKALKIFADNLNKLINFLHENFIQFNPRVLKFDDAADIPKETLAQQLVLLGMQLKPFIEIGIENKDYAKECAFASVVEITSEETAVSEVEDIGNSPRYCAIM